MKLSTSAYSRGKVGTIVGLLVMGLLVALTEGDISLTIVCIAGAATWLAVVWLLTANKDKEVL
jgi:hypothetical protein